MFIPLSTFKHHFLHFVPGDKITEKLISFRPWSVDSYNLQYEMARVRVPHKLQEQKRWLCGANRTVFLSGYIIFSIFSHTNGSHFKAISEQQHWQRLLWSCSFSIDIPLSNIKSNLEDFK